MKIGYTEARTWEVKNDDDKGRAKSQAEPDPRRRRLEEYMREMEAQAG
jgi:hypothetical protein